MSARLSFHNHNQGAHIGAPLRKIHSGGGDHMTYNSDIHQRRSTRLPGYDYSQPGAYFITICTKNKECLFGGIVAGEMQLNGAGEMIQRWYDALENHFAGIQRGEIICMPNHIHFIINNVGADRCVCPPFVPQSKPGRTHRCAPTKQFDSTNLSTVIQWFKTMTTNEYIHGVKHHGWPPFAGKLWQRNYYDHIIRNDTDLNRIREYMQTNPAKWESDSLYQQST